MFKLNWSIDKRDVEERLKTLSSKMKNLKPVMNVIGQTIRTSIVKNFEIGGRPQGWKTLSPVTVKQKRKGVGKILIDSGRLMKSIKIKSYPDRVEVGTNLVYAAIHHFGGQAGRGHRVTIPARPYMLIQKEDWAEIYREAGDYLLRKG